MKTLEEMNNEGLPRGLYQKYKLQALSDYSLTYDVTLNKKAVMDALPDSAYTVDETTQTCTVDTAVIEAYLNENP